MSVKFRSDDIDLTACAQRNIPIVGVNERHRAVDGRFVRSKLLSSGLRIYSNRVAPLCDNDFAQPIRTALADLGASVEMFSTVGKIFRDRWDAIVLALRPALEPRVGPDEARHLETMSPQGVTMIQFGGDVGIARP